MRNRPWPVPLIALLGLGFFYPLVLHPGQVLYSDHSDFLAEHLPARRFLVSSYQETGELPLWCPYMFGGMPFIHDPQVAAYYPPHALLYLLSPDRVGAGLSWLVVAHVILAGWCMYAYARSRDLSNLGALVAAFCYMFAGKWMLHLLGGGHYILIGLAWLPLVLLCLERAIRRRSLLSATWAGVVFALVVLGTHPQWTFYAGLFLALWTLGTALENAGAGSRVVALGWWLGLGLWTVLVAGALAAVQLLPTAEAAGLSSRAEGHPRDDLLVAMGQVLPQFIGPSPADPAWEYRGGLAVLPLTAAVLAVVLCGRRVRRPVVVCLVLVLFAVGGGVVLQTLPGFRRFHLPVRMLTLTALPLAFLAGVATDELFAGPVLAPGRRRRCRRLLLGLALAAVALMGVDVVRAWVCGQVLHPPAYWFVLPGLVLAAWWALGEPRSLSRGVVWALVLLADLLALAWPLVGVRSEAEIYPPSACVRYLAERRGEGHRVLDWDLLGGPLGYGAPLAVRERIESLRGYNPLDNRRYKEYFRFIGDEDEPLRPFDWWSGPIMMGNVPLRNKSLLDLLGVGYLLLPDEEAHRAADACWQPVCVDASPGVYDFVWTGWQQLPPYTIYRNSEVLPRAFVVAEAAPLPPREEVLAALKATDFRRCVLLEGYSPDANAEPRPADFRPAVIREYRPNRVVVEVEEGAAGFLVLADVWFPGWTCAVDGKPCRVYCANYLFRAVELPAGSRQVAFTFAPESYIWGRRISAIALGVVIGLILVGWIAGRLRDGPNSRLGSGVS